MNQLQRDVKGLERVSSEKKYYPGQKNRCSRDIHEIDPQCNHVISGNIDFDLQHDSQRAGRVDVEPKLDIARYHLIGLSDQPHEFLGCNDF